MENLTRAVVAFAIAVGMIAVVPGAAGADSDLLDSWLEPFGDPTIIDAVGADAEAPVFDLATARSTTFASQVAEDAVIVTGAGYGHGVGMSQWGAHGQAIAGFQYDDILEFYYGGAVAGTSLVSYDAAAPGHDNLWVNLEYDRTDLMLQVLDTSSEMPGGGHAPATLTRGADSVGLAGGQTAKFTWLTENECTVAFRNSTDLNEIPFAEWAKGSCDIDIVWDGEADSPSTKVEIVGCSLKDWDAGVYRPCQYGRGAALHTIDNESPQRSSSGMDGSYNGFDLVLEIDVDDYTLGISEVSYTWPSAALGAQAVAARSYAAAAIEDGVGPFARPCACDVYDTSRSQRYVGWGHVGVPSQQNWVAACQATDNQVLANPASETGGVISAVYSAANGGASENHEDIWTWAGPPLPYLRSVPDPFDLTFDTSWTRTIPHDYFAAKVGLDTVTSTEILATYVSGSPSDIAVTGISSGKDTTKHYTAVQFMGLFSGTTYWFPAPRILTVNMPDSPPPSPPPFELTRLWGDDRYATAAAVSVDGYPDGSDRLFVATGENFPDALAVAPLARQLGGPVLLTQTDAIPATTMSEIERLNPQHIYVLGGPIAITDAVEQTLSQYGFVSRLWGEDRYATAATISETAFPTGATVAYVAVGSDFPDAVVGAPVAAHRNGPLLLTRSDMLSAPTRAELERLQPDTIIVVGGGASISTSVVNEMRPLAPNLSTLAGSDRYMTSAEVSEHAFPGGASTVYVARGTLYPDALAGGPAAADAPAPILLVRENTLPGTIAAELVRLSPNRVVILGGDAAVSPLVEQAILDLLG